MIGDLDMRRDVQEIFRKTPHDKQVLMFSATLPKELRAVCKKFMQDVRYFPTPIPQFPVVSSILLSLPNFLSPLPQPFCPTPLLITEGPGSTRLR